MLRKLILSLFLVLLSSATVVAEDNGSNQPAESQESSAPTGQKGPDVPGPGESDAKMIRGMAVLGNNEAPMSLFIVPWKSSELGIETNLSRTLNERDVPIDREVFRRELDFYQVSVHGKEAAPAAVSKMLQPR